MKSVLQAGWLLTVAVGNIIVLIIAEAATLDEQVGSNLQLLWIANSIEKHMVVVLAL